jgi:hypothetical protein
MSACQFQIPPACAWRSKIRTLRPASDRCREAVSPEGPEPMTATERMGWSNWCRPAMVVSCSATGYTKQRQRFRISGGVLRRGELTDAHRHSRACAVLLTGVDRSVSSGLASE